MPQLFFKKPFCEGSRPWWWSTGLLVLLSCCQHAPAVPTAEAQALIDIAAIQQTNDSLITDLKSALQTGDLVLRTGTDFSSEQVKQLSRSDQTYSHAGIAVWDSGYWKVYHIEPDYYLLNDKVRKELLDTFLHRSHNAGFAFARFQLEREEITAFLHYLDEQYRNGIPFDMNFELATDQYLYCSEMIKKGLSKATHNRIQITVQPLNDRSKFKLIKQYFKLKEKDFVNRPIVPIDQLYLNPHCQVIKRYIYRE